MLPTRRLSVQNSNSIVQIVLSLKYFCGRLAQGFALSFTLGNVAGTVGGMWPTITAAAFGVI